MNPQLLQNLLSTDPTLQALSDADAATSLSTPTLVPVPYQTFQSGMMQLACWGAIRVAAATSTTPANVLGLCLTAIDLLTNYKGATVDMSLPAFTAAMNGLVAAALVSDSDHAAILAMGQVYRAGGVVATADVTAARAANARQAVVNKFANQIANANGSGLSVLNTWANGTAALPSDMVQQIQTAMSGQVTG